LEVPMNNATGMSSLERLRGLNDQRNSHVDRQLPIRCLSQHVRQVLAVEQFHHDERLAAVRAEVMDHGDSGMLQLCRDSCFTLESSGISELVSHHLHRYRPLKLLIDAPPDLAHTPRAQDLLQDVPSGDRGASLHSAPPV